MVGERIAEQLDYRAATAYRTFVDALPNFRSFEPPILSAHLPAPGGFVPDTCESFVVDEIPLYAPSGQGEHTYLRIRKTRWTTPAAIEAIARAARANKRDIGYAGMKDKFAVTSQWISLPPRSLVPESLPAGIEILEVARHNNKLRVGHNAGNRFTLYFRNEDAGAAERYQQVADFLGSARLPNFFGPQRFGRDGGNLEEAVRFLREAAGGNRRDHQERKLLASVVQSEIFNRYAQLRLDLAEPLLVGEVVRLSRSRAMFVVEDLPTELARFESGEIVRTGPLIGPKLMPAGGRILELEKSATASLGLDPADFDALGENAPGTRRDLELSLTDFEFEILDSCRFRVSFSLPSGSYATQVAREFTRLPWQNPLRPVSAS